MAVDRNGKTIVVGDDYFVIATARSVSTEETLMTSGKNSQHATRCKNTSMSAVAAMPVSTVVLDGKSSDSNATSLPLCVASSNMPLTGGVNDLGVPVVRPSTASSVAVSWKSNNTSGDPGNWTLKLHKRQAGNDLLQVATFTITTNNN